MNETIINKGINITSKIVEPIKNKIAELGLQYTGTLASIFTALIGAILIWVSLKVANKVIKVIIVILGIVLIIGTIGMTFGNLLN